MHPPVRDTIRELRLTQVARKMGLPISTVFRWMSQDRIPGRGRAHDWRVAQFETAVAALRAESGSAIATEGAER
jgi:predicted DNA-binding transcriptional regulator AlpA